MINIFLMKLATQQQNTLIIMVLTVLREMTCIWLYRLTNLRHTVNSIACGYVFNVNIETENTRVVDIFNNKIQLICTIWL